MRLKAVLGLQVFIMVFWGASLSAADSVEGYRMFTWNTSATDLLAQIKERDFCTAKDLKEDSIGIRTITCEDFPFVERGRYGYFLLLEDKLHRIGVTLEAGEVGLLKELLGDQYGKVKTESNNNQQIDEWRWAGGGVIIKRLNVKDEVDGKLVDKDIYVLMYSSAKYGDELRKLRQNKYKEFTQ